MRHSTRTNKQYKEERLAQDLYSLKSAYDSAFGALRISFARKEARITKGSREIAIRGN